MQKNWNKRTFFSKKVGKEFARVSKLRSELFQTFFV